jgi:hypothetical protein
VAEGRHLLGTKIDAAVVDLEVRDGDEAELIRQLHEGDPATGAGADHRKTPHGVSHSLGSGSRGGAN